MKIKFCHDNGANIHSKVSQVFDLEDDFGITDAEWNAMDEEAKYNVVREWAMQHFEYWFEEVK